MVRGLEAILQLVQWLSFVVGMSEGCLMPLPEASFHVEEASHCNCWSLYFPLLSPSLGGKSGLSVNKLDQAPLGAELAKCSPRSLLLRV